VTALWCEHLVVGGGLLGLATADHLLRRGARSVHLIERRGGPNAGRPGEPGAVIQSGLAPLAELEARARTLLESPEEVLGVELPFRRAGSLRIPAAEPTPPGCEWLAEEQLAARFPGLLAPGLDARFTPSDGTIETLPILAALHGRLRAQGGRLVVDAELLELREDEDSVHFTAAGRSGRAGRVHLAAGAENLRFLPALGARHGWRSEVVHAFQLLGARSSGAALWLPEARAALAPLGGGVWELEIAVDVAPGARGEPSVDWTLLERFRIEQGERIPWLRDTQVRRARVLPRLAFAPEETLLVSRLGRIVAAGAFGVHGLALHSAVAEMVAERGLAPLSEAGGLLEEG